MPTMIEAALGYAARGWMVMPVWAAASTRCSCPAGARCRSPGKHPRLEHGVLDSSADPAVVTSWPWDGAAPAVATGDGSGLLVIDLDAGHGGLLAWDLLRAGREVPALEVLTGGGGLHLYLARPPGAPGAWPNRIGVATGIDVRCDGGYVVAPPAPHASGGAYSWASDPAAPLPPVPAWLLPLLRAATPPPAPAGIDHGRLAEGGRNRGLTAIAGRLRRQGISGAALAAALAAENVARCDPPLPEAEVARIASSVARYPAGPGPGIPDRPDAWTWLGHMAATRGGDAVAIARAACPEPRRPDLEAGISLPPGSRVARPADVDAAGSRRASRFLQRSPDPGDGVEILDAVHQDIGGRVRVFCTVACGGQRVRVEGVEMDVLLDYRRMRVLCAERGCVVLPWLKDSAAFWGGLVAAALSDARREVHGEPGSATREAAIREALGEAVAQAPRRPAAEMTIGDFRAGEAADLGDGIALCRHHLRSATWRALADLSPPPTRGDLVAAAVALGASVSHATRLADGVVAGWFFPAPIPVPLPLPLPLPPPRST